MLVISSRGSRMEDLRQKQKRPSVLRQVSQTASRHHQGTDIFFCFGFCFRFWFWSWFFFCSSMFLSSVLPETSATVPVCKEELDLPQSTSSRPGLQLQTSGEIRLHDRWLQVQTPTQPDQNQETFQWNVYLTFHSKSHIKVLLKLKESTLYIHNSEK